MKNVLFVASECVPFIKTGGLADVVGSLPKCFNKDEFDVRVIIPKYMCMKEEYKNQLEYITHFYMDLSWRSQYVGVLHMMYEGIHYYFIDNEYYLAGPRPYGNIYEDIEKFAFFSKAALSALPLIGFKPDIVHCHDWQTGLIPVFLKDKFHEGEFFCNMKSIMTIHNLKFQGVWDVKTIQHFSELPDYYFTPDKLEAYKDGNMLKGGIVYADAITTVSNTYAEEIKTPFYGEGLDGLMRARSNSLRGILNGIDYDEFNPETDKRIVQNYNAKTFRKEKSKNKKALQAELGLAQDEKKFMIGIVSRLTDQKGLDLVQCVMDEICTEDVQLVVLSTTSIASGGSSPRRCSERTSSPSRRRVAASERSKMPRAPVTFIRRSAISSRWASAPADWNWVTRKSPYWSTMRPGRPSASPKMRRSAVARSRSGSRASTASRIFFSNHAASITSPSRKLQQRTRRVDLGEKAP